jgi:hypothetical protein
MPNNYEFPPLDLPASLKAEVPASSANIVNPTIYDGLAETTSPNTQQQGMAADARIKVYFAKAKGGYFGEVHTEADTLILIGRTWEDFVENLSKIIRRNG